MTSNRLVDILAPSIQGPEGPYRCIYLDPPWPENGGGKSKRGADRHYPTMSVAAIGSLLDRVLFQYGENAEEQIAEDAHCWMWVTDNYLQDGLDLMEFMGFNYKRTLVWAKISPKNIQDIAGEAAECVLDCFSPKYAHTGPDYKGARKYLVELLGESLNARKGGLLRSGLGHYARGSHELLLFGSRGKTHFPPTDVVPKSVQFAPITEHSAKPELFYNIIEACSPGPRLEMFARNARPGWAVFGNEVEA